MKLRVRGNSIRLRLTKTEVAAIGNGQSIIESTYFGRDSSFRYSLEPSFDSESISARVLGSEIKILLPIQSALDWANSEQVSMVMNQDIGQGDSLRILIEKDFFCLKPRSFEIEDESEMFQNPNKDHGNCGGHP